MVNNELLIIVKVRNSHLYSSIFYFNQLHSSARLINLINHLDLQILLTRTTTLDCISSRPRRPKTKPIPSNFNLDFLSLISSHILAVISKPSLYGINSSTVSLLLPNLVKIHQNSFLS